MVTTAPPEPLLETNSPPAPHAARGCRRAATARPDQEPRRTRRASAITGTDCSTHGDGAPANNTAEVRRFSAVTSGQSSGYNYGSAARIDHGFPTAAENTRECRPVVESRISIGDGRAASLRRPQHSTTVEWASFGEVSRCGAGANFALFHFGKVVS